MPLSQRWKRLSRIVALTLLRPPRMQADISWSARRLVVLRDLLSRWLAELPVIKAADAERANAHAQGIEDLRRMIEGIEMEYGCIPHPGRDSQCGTSDVPLLEMPRHDPPAMPG